MITKTRGGHDFELRAMALTDMVKWGYSGLRNVGGGTVSEREMRGLPAMNRAARLRAEAVASLRLRCWRGDGPLRERVESAWQARLLGSNPNPEQSRFVFWETLEESLAYRNNAYAWKNVDPVSSRVIEIYALHPDQVTCLRSGRYAVSVAPGFTDPVGKGRGRYEVDDETILHIRGHGQGGTEEAPTPIQVFKDALVAPAARQRHEARMWKRGTALQIAVSFPQGITKEQAEEWRDTIRTEFEGTEGDTTFVVGGGAQVQPIGMTAADAMFVEMAKLTVHDAARIMGVPAELLGAQLERTRPDLEQVTAGWFRFGLGPELERIEAALAADEQLFGSVGRNADIYPAFDTTGFVRADVMTEATILQRDVQVGILVPDEARAIRGYPPHPDGLGAIPQITPVGGAPNPDLIPPTEKPADPGDGGTET